MAAAINLTRLASLLLLLLTLHTTLSAASGCTLPPCGRVDNKTRWRGKWADLSGGDHYCQVYNWKGGKGSVGHSAKRVKCQQRTVNAHSAVGGWTHDLIDVDGITFHDRRWRIIWENGKSFDLAEGVWAKIGSGETATCRENVQVPECRVTCGSALRVGCIG